MTWCCWPAAADELPCTVGALRTGRLSIDQAVVVARSVPAFNDRESCALALECSVSQLRASIGRWAWNPPYPPADADDADDADHADDAARDDGTARAHGAGGTPSDPDCPSDPADPACPSSPVDDGPVGADPATPPKSPPRTPPDPRMADGELSFWFDERGRFQLRLDAPTGDGAIIEAALREARDALFQAGQRDVSWADAFNEVCRRARASNHITGIGLSRSDRYRVSIHLDTEGAWINGSTRVPRALLDQILCDGIVQPVWTTGGHPVNVGRTTKTISPHLQRLILHRDHNECRVPGCTSTLGLHVHHIRWFQRDNGPTETWNLMAGCGRCHRHIHQGHIHVTGDADQPDGLRFTDQHGHDLIRHPTPVPPTDPPPPPSQHQHPTGERLWTRWLHFTEPPPVAEAAPVGQPEPQPPEPQPPEPRRASPVVNDAGPAPPTTTRAA